MLVLALANEMFTNADVASLMGAGLYEGFDVV